MKIFHINTLRGDLKGCRINLALLESDSCRYQPFHRVSPEITLRLTTFISKRCTLESLICGLTHSIKIHKLVFAKCTANANYRNYPISLFTPQFYSETDGSSKDCVINWSDIDLDPHEKALLNNGPNPLLQPESTHLNYFANLNV
ncbi:hypothetical protein GJ496_000642 [Pomphorhynchus laevis]|nr:hypothetical protein GJ496_000642 [Pomphorhynchus laevis]